MLPEEIDRWAAILHQRRAALAGRDPAAAAAIDAALERLQAGTFGLCARCGQAISADRMQAQPSASTCLACQELLERQRSFLPLTLL